MKRMYGILEKQYRKYFNQASREKANTGTAFLTLLERRLDNAVYRLGLAPTRAAARQYISHKHIFVDGKKVNIPSFQVKENMVITATAKILETPVVKKQLEDKTPNLPKWLERKGPIGKVVRLPQRDDILDDINEQLIIEFYSR